VNAREEKRRRSKDAASPLSSERQTESELAESALVVLAAGRERAQASLLAFDQNGAAGESSSIFGEAVDEHIVMVKEVEGLGTEFDTNTFGYLERLAGSEIEIPCSRSAERIAANHARRIRTEVGDTEVADEAVRRRQSE
jgi:hypothetical protein